MGAHRPGVCSSCNGPTSKRRFTMCAACKPNGSQAPGATTSLEPATGATDSLSVSGDRCEITKLTHERVKTLAQLVAVCEIDLSEWEVERFVANKWDMGFKDADQKAHALPLFQVKAWLRRKVTLVDARTEIAALLVDAKAKAVPRPRPPGAPSPVGKTGLMFEPHIPDLHIGKLAWADETGDANYDAKIAAETFRAAVLALLARVKGHRFDEIVFPVGNDLLHSDTKQGTTTGGTPLDTDSRYQKNFSEARRAITWAIEAFRGVAPRVRVVLIPGNHDTLSTWHLGDSLECFYHRTPDVVIDNTPTMRKYHQHGKVMLMWTHGNRGKLQDYPLLMATERPEMFGATLFREAHTGDKHQLRVQEHRGVKVRISPALCPADAWHSEMHFTGQARAAEGFVWSETEGLIVTATYTVPRVESAA